MKRLWLGAFQLGAAAVLMTASAGAYNRTIPATAISTYQDFNCFYKDIGDLQLSSSCRHSTEYAFLPMEADPDYAYFSARVRNYTASGSGCYDSDSGLGAYTFDQEGDVHSWSGWKYNSGGWAWIESGDVPMYSSTEPGSVAIAFMAWSESGCSAAQFGTVEVDIHD